MRNIIKQLNYLNVLNFSTPCLIGFCEFANNQINQKNAIKRVKAELDQCLASVSILFKNQLFFIFDTASWSIIPSSVTVLGIYFFLIF